MKMTPASVFEHDWCTEAIFLRSLLKAKVILTAILRQQMEIWE